MAIGISSSLRDARATLILDALDAGVGAGELRLYNGARPATGGLTTTLLGTCVLSDPSGTVSSGTLTFSAIASDVAADATGTITWGRFVDSNGNFVADVSCGLAGSGSEIIFNTVDAIIGGAIQITAFSITEGGA